MVRAGTVSCAVQSHQDVSVVSILWCESIVSLLLPVCQDLFCRDDRERHVSDEEEDDRRSKQKRKGGGGGGRDAKRSRR